LNPGDANIIIGLRKPGVKACNFDLSRSCTNTNPTGKGKLHLHDVSKFFVNISHIKKEYSQIVNINKEQFMETKAQNKEARKVVTSTTTTVVEKKVQSVTPSLSKGNPYADQLLLQLDGGSSSVSSSNKIVVSGGNISSTKVVTSNVSYGGDDYDTKVKYYGGSTTTTYGGTTVTSSTVTSSTYTTSGTVYKSYN
jgi:hypothetical protein